MNIDIVGLSAGSVIINNSNFIISLFCIITLHILFICFEKCTRRRFSRFKFYRKAMKMTFKFFTLAVYIRTVLEAYQYLLICSVYEVDFFSTNSIDQCISIVFAFLLLFFCIKFFGIIVCKTYWQNPHLKDLDTKAFKELFEGIKITRTAKWFNTMLVLRRMLLIIFLICFRLLSIYIKVGYVVLVQAICLGYLMISNPLIELKFSIVNFIDEIEFLGLTCMLFVYNKKSDWTSRAESVFMYSIAGCNTMVSIIYFISFIILLIKCRKSKTTQKYNTTSIDPKNNLIRDDISNHSIDSQIIDESKFDRFRNKRNRSFHTDRLSEQEEEKKMPIYKREISHLDNSDINNLNSVTFRKRSSNEKISKIYLRESE